MTVIRHKKLNLEATKYEGNDQAVTPSFPYLLNKVNNRLLPYFHYFFIEFHYRSLP